MVLEEREKEVRVSGLPPDEHCDLEEPEEEVPSAHTGEMEVEEEGEAESPALDTSRALQESPHTSTQKHTSLRVPPRGRLPHSSRERPKGSKNQTEPRPAQSQSSQGSTNSNQTRPVTGAIQGRVQSCIENPPQDSGPQDSETDDRNVRGARLRTGPCSSDPPDRLKGQCEPEPELDSAGVEEEAEDRLAETSLQLTEDQPQLLRSTSGQRRSATRRKSTRTTDRL